MAGKVAGLNTRLPIARQKHKNRCQNIPQWAVSQRRERCNPFGLGLGCWRNLGRYGSLRYGTDAFSGHLTILYPIRPKYGINPKGVATLAMLLPANPTRGPSGAETAATGACNGFFRGLRP